MSLLNGIIRNVVFECIDALEECESEVKHLDRQIIEYKQKMDEYIDIICKKNERIKELESTAHLAPSLIKVESNE